ncbi:putative Ig domain-containing protein [Streptosporangium lutulentum]
MTDPGSQSATSGTAITPLTLRASGGTAPYTWTATGLPAGLTLSSDGTVSGTPTSAGTASVTVTATDSTGATGSATFRFQVAGDGSTIVPIASIQGTNTDTSPYKGQTVTTEGVVTAVYATGGFNGFFLETGGAGKHDKTPGASDAVFVFGAGSASQVSIGESVRVTGEVTEYQGETEIQSPTVTKLAKALLTVVSGQIPWSDLTTDAAKEAHEGELIAPQGTFTVSDNYDANYYGSFTLAAGEKPLRQPTDAGTAGSAAAKAAAADNAARMVTLDDGSSANYSTSASRDIPLPWLTTTNPVTVGSKVTFHEPVILEYRFSLWNFQPRQQVTDNGAKVATFSDLRTGNQQRLRRRRRPSGHVQRRELLPHDRRGLRRQGTGQVHVLHGPAGQPDRGQHVHRHGRRLRPARRGRPGQLRPPAVEDRHRYQPARRERRVAGGDRELGQVR